MSTAVSRLLAIVVVCVCVEGCNEESATLTTSCTDSGTDAQVCAAAGAACGTAEDECGVVRTCDTCSSVTTCVAGVCSAPPQGTLRIEDSCGAFAACGVGDVALEGDWHYVDACIEKAVLFEALFSLCTAATIDSTSGETLSGLLRFTAPGLVSRNLSLSVDVTTTIPLSCSAGLCLQVEAALDAAFDHSASCSGSSSCTCTFTARVAGADSGGYTVDAATLVINSTANEQREFAVCVDAGQLRYTEVTAGDHEPGVYTLAQ